MVRSVLSNARATIAPVLVRSFSSQTLTHTHSLTHGHTHTPVLLGQAGNRSLILRAPHKVHDEHLFFPLSLYCFFFLDAPLSLSRSPPNFTRSVALSLPLPLSVIHKHARERSHTHAHTRKQQQTRSQHQRSLARSLSLSDPRTGTQKRACVHAS